MAREQHSFDVDTDRGETLRIHVYRETGSKSSGWFCDNAILGCSRAFHFVKPVTAINTWLREHGRSGRAYRRINEEE